MKCIICGKEIEPGVLGKVRANAKYCSDECREEGKRRYSSTYAKERRATDEEWLKRRRAESALYQKAYRDRHKEAMLEECAEQLAKMSDASKVREYLDEHFRIKLS